MPPSFRANFPDSPTHRHATAGRPGLGERPNWDVLPGRVRDVSDMLNLVVSAAAEGHFTEVYLDVRYQLGLALQLFGAVLLGRVRVGTQPVSRARVRVVRQGRDVIGFALMRHLPGEGSAHLELHLLAVHAHARQSGVGKALLADALSALQEGQCLFVTTLPNAHGMKRLVRKSGGRSLGPVSLKPRQC